MKDTFTLRVTRTQEGFTVEIVELGITHTADTLERAIEEGERAIARALMEQDCQAQAAARAS